MKISPRFFVALLASAVSIPTDAAVVTRTIVAPTLRISGICGTAPFAATPLSAPPLSLILTSPIPAAVVASAPQVITAAASPAASPVAAFAAQPAASSERASSALESVAVGRVEGGVYFDRAKSFSAMSAVVPAEGPLSVDNRAAAHRAASDSAALGVAQYGSRLVPAAPPALSRPAGLVGKIGGALKFLSKIAAGTLAVAGLGIGVFSAYAFLAGLIFLSGTLFLGGITGMLVGTALFEVMLEYIKYVSK